MRRSAFPQTTASKGFLVEHRLVLQRQISEHVAPKGIGAPSGYFKPIGTPAIIPSVRPDNGPPHLIGFAIQHFRCG